MRVVDWLLASMPAAIGGARKLDAIERILDRMEAEQREEEERLDAAEAMFRARATVVRKERPT